MPFYLTPDPKFLYLSPGHREILDSLISGIRERLRLIVLVGEQGVGKSTLFDAALDRFVEGIKVTNILNTDMSFERMLAMALIDLGLTKPEETLSAAEMVDRLKTFATQQLAKEGGVVFIVKDSQNLEHRAMEDLLLLSDLESHEHKLVQIVLSGQPELETKLSQPEFRQLESRINLMLHINPLGEEETYNYVQHRLTTASYKGPALFEGGALKLVWEYSGGVPRRINTVCDNALLISYGRGKKGIEASVVKEAIKDLSWEPFSGDYEVPTLVLMEEEETPEAKPRRARFRLAFSGGLVLVLCVIFAVWFFRDSDMDFQSVESGPAKGGVGVEATSQPDSTEESEPPFVKEYIYKGQESDKPLLETREVESVPGLEASPTGEGEVLKRQEVPGLTAEEKAPVTPKESGSVREESDEKVSAVPALARESKREAAKTGKMSVQLGAFREKRTAEGLKRRLMDKGYDAYLEEVEVKGKGSLHRVRIRCCSNLTEAKAVKAQLRKQGFGNSFIVGQKKN